MATTDTEKRNSPAPTATLAEGSARVLENLRKSESPLKAADVQANLGLNRPPTTRLQTLMRLGLIAYNSRTDEWSVTPAGENIEIEIKGEPAKPLAAGRRKGTTAGKRNGLKEQAAKAQATAKARSSSDATPAVREGSMTWAMLEVMRGKRNPMTAKEVTAAIMERKLAPGLKGKTPDATVGAKLATESKKPNGLFKREAPGQYKVR